MFFVSSPHSPYLSSSFYFLILILLFILFLVISSFPSSSFFSSPLLLFILPPNNYSLPPPSTPALPPPPSPPLPSASSFPLLFFSFSSTSSYFISPSLHSDPSPLFATWPMPNYFPFIFTCLFTIFKAFPISTMFEGLRLNLIRVILRIMSCPNLYFPISNRIFVSYLEPNVRSPT